MSEQPLVLDAPSTTLPSPRQLTLQVGVATFSRLVINTSRRFVYPFAPALSRGVGVPLTAITSLIAINNATGVLSPLFGPLSDRWGYRAMMLAGLSLLAVGMMASGVLPFYGVLLVALFLAGLGKAIFDPALQAYVGERIPYRRRGLVIGVIEFGWAGSSLIGIPLVGLLIDRLGWQAPFLVLGGLALLSIVAFRLFFPTDRPQQCPSRHTTNFKEAWRQLGSEPAALGTLGFGFCLSLANDMLFVILGVWLEQSFALSIVALGTATSVIGVAELCGETLTASISDRLGLKRSIIGGAVLSVLSYGLLPVAGQTLSLALGALFVLFLCFEFTVVTALSLSTELLPGARATMMSTLQATVSIGRVIGAIIGGLVWLAGGLPMVSFLAAFITGLGLAFLLWGLRGWRD